MKHSDIKFSAQLFNCLFEESAAAQMYALTPTPGKNVSFAKSEVSRNSNRSCPGVGALDTGQCICVFIEDRI